MFHKRKKKIHMHIRIRDLNFQPVTRKIAFSKYVYGPEKLSDAWIENLRSELFNLIIDDIRADAFKHFHSETSFMIRFTTGGFELWASEKPIMATRYCVNTRNIVTIDSQWSETGQHELTQHNVEQWFARWAESVEDIDWYMLGLLGVLVSTKRRYTTKEHKKLKMFQRLNREQAAIALLSYQTNDDADISLATIKGLGL